MQIVLLSGGSGKRLWPLSNDSRSKQFLRLLKDDYGNYESMVQRVHRQIKETGIEAEITVSTNALQRDSIRTQLGKGVDIIIEPERRDTFPAILLACNYLHAEKNVKEDETVIVLPVDPYTNEDYFNTLALMEKAVEKDCSEIVLMGIKPTYPSDKYGYILPEKKSEFEKSFIYSVRGFKEKPDRKSAEELIREGAYWNGGVFAFKLSYILKILKTYNLSGDMEALLESYTELPKTSFDYAVVEKEKSLSMIPYNGYWKDLGTWNTFSEEIRDTSMGNVFMDEHSYNTTVINECGKPVVVLGAPNVIVAVSPDGILVSDKYQSGFLKTYVDKIENIPMFEEKIWGSYSILDSQRLDDGTVVVTKLLILNTGKYLDYKTHLNSSSIWMVIEGRGTVVLDDKTTDICAGDTININPGQKYAFCAKKKMKIMEIQRGVDSIEPDVRYYDWDWNSQEAHRR